MVVLQPDFVPVDEITHAVTAEIREDGEPDPGGIILRGIDRAVAAGSFFLQFQLQGLAPFFQLIIQCVRIG